MKKFILIEEILALSIANNWESAKREWKLETIYDTDAEAFCLCGHKIHEVCVIENHKNGTMAEVGNCCINKFPLIPTQSIFNCLKRMKANTKKSANKTLLSFAHQKRIIDDWEFVFYSNIMFKRELSEKQNKIKQGINSRLLYWLENNGVSE